MKTILSGYINFAYNNYYNMGKFSDAFTIKVLVFIFKQPYKKINEEQMQQGNFVIKDDKRLLHMDYRGLKEENLCVEYQENGCRI